MARDAVPKPGIQLHLYSTWAEQVLPLIPRDMRLQFTLLVFDLGDEETRATPQAQIHLQWHLLKLHSVVQD